MLIYKDILSNDEMISDSYDLKEVDGIVYEADCAMITLGAVNINTGANASAEEAEETLDDGEIKVNNIINSFRLQETSFNKQSFIPYLKEYMKAIKAKLPPNQVEAFEAGAKKFVKETLLPNFKNYEFYTGESQSPDGMVALLNYRKDGVTPYFTFWKHGLVTEKV
ncbi:hypothetical protein Cpir12675_001949 [Ceratocystis pirilliformis]|uniref:Translationally-controlled tumor protein homolog n=1 Tax=Ceratocystis pirilliformis TaxID=259994 RepID=A0ABR3ZFK3_9PEZI